MGHFYPTPRLLSVLCHEVRRRIIAKIIINFVSSARSYQGTPDCILCIFATNEDLQHMNHSPAFHKLRLQLSAEVASLQRKGYFGDGMWSAGTRLADSRRVAGDTWASQELPEYTVCPLKLPFQYYTLTTQILVWRSILTIASFCFTFSQTSKPTSRTFAPYRCSDDETAQSRIPCNV